MSETRALAQGIAVLQAAGIDDAAGDARRLWRMAAAGSTDKFLALIRQRAERVPLSHLLGYRDFYQHRFIVSSKVLDPRPDTETLVETALENPFRRVLDLGTGSGCILLSLIAASADATGVGVDVSRDALEVAELNRVALGLEDRTAFRQSDWFRAVDGQFDLIVSNPPYIAADEMDGLQPEVRLHEPRIALTDEADGLTAYRAITTGAFDYLLPGGRLIVEIGPTQAAAVTRMFAKAGFEGIRVMPDLDGRDRVIVGSRP
ncbi:MAG: peptide chain release factor N(5)-glutamine methyltransferase [Pseudomonadota bacterium]